MLTGSSRFRIIQFPKTVNIKRDICPGMCCAWHKHVSLHVLRSARTSDLHVRSAAYPICCARRAMPRYAVAATNRDHLLYTLSPLQDSRLFGPSPWKILATTYEQKDFWATQPLAKILWAGILLWPTLRSPLPRARRSGRGLCARQRCQRCGSGLQQIMRDNVSWYHHRC